MTQDCFLQHMVRVENGYELGAMQFVVVVCMVMYIVVSFPAGKQRQCKFEVWQ